MRPITQVSSLESTACFCLFIRSANPHWAPAKRQALWTQRRARPRTGPRVQKLAVKRQRHAPSSAGISRLGQFGGPERWRGSENTPWVNVPQAGKCGRLSPEG